MYLFPRSSFISVCLLCPLLYRLFPVPLRSSVLPLIDPDRVGPAFGTVLRSQQLSSLADDWLPQPHTGCSVFGFELPKLVGCVGVPKGVI